MEKDLLAVLGIDGVAAITVYVIEPLFLKWVLIGGLASLIGLYFFTKQGKVSIYGTQLVMGIILAIHFA